jgi:hypothetical protein
MALAPEFAQTFSEGSLVGGTAALEGISFSLSVSPDQEDAVKIGIEAGHVGLDVVAEALHIARVVAEPGVLTGAAVGATAGGVLLGLLLPVINLLAALEVYAPDPRDVADLLGDALTARLGGFGATGAVSLFFVFAMVSVDSVLGGAYNSQEQAENAARDLNQGDSFIARLNTGSPNSLELAAVA